MMPLQVKVAEDQLARRWRPLHIWCLHTNWFLHNTWCLHTLGFCTPSGYLASRPSQASLRRGSAVGYKLWDKACRTRFPDAYLMNSVDIILFKTLGLGVIPNLEVCYCGTVRAPRVR